MFNKVTLIGRLCKDGEFKAFNSGAEIYENTLALNKKQKNGTDKTIFVKIKVFGNAVNIMRSYTQKGDKNTNGFDYNAFVEWAQKQVALGFNVFLSEFETPCPATFKEIASVKKGINLAKGKSDRNFVLEKLFLARGIK